MLESLTPGQKQMLMAGVPVVAVFAFLSSRKKAAAPAAATAGVPMPTNAVLGADALNSFMDQMSQNFGHLQMQVDSLGAIDTTAPAPPPTPAAAPSTIDNTATPPTAVAMAPAPLPPGVGVAYGTSITGVPWSYGGQAAQAADLVGAPPQAPLPVPASWGVAGTWADPHYSWT